MSVAKGFVLPISAGGYWVSQGYNVLYSGHGYHLGEDMAASLGTQVNATGNGVVVYAGSATGYGQNFVAIKHTLTDGTFVTSYYGHMNSKQVSVGQTVVAGQGIGTVGSEGNSTGPHLHFAIFVGSGAPTVARGYVSYPDPDTHARYADPFWFVNAHSTPAPPPAVNQAPVITGQTSVTHGVNQSFNFNSLISASDPDGSVASYTFYDSTAGTGYLTLNGGHISGSSVTVAASNLSQVGYFTGGSGGSNQIAIDAIDNQGKSSTDFLMNINVTAATTTNHPPLGYGHNQSGVAAGTHIALSTLFTYFDKDSGDRVTGFSVQDVSAGGGHLYYNGVLADNVVYGNTATGIPISQIGQWSYVAGPAGSTDTLHFTATDSHGAFNHPAAVATVTATPPASSDTVLDTTRTTSVLHMNGATTGVIDTGAVSGSANSNFDHDWYRVTLTQGHSYNFSARGTGTLNDVAIDLKDSSGTSNVNPTHTFVDSGPNGTANFAYTAASTGTYYLAISAGGNNLGSLTGNYSIGATDTAPSPVSSDTVGNNRTNSASLGVGHSVVGTINQNDISGYYVDSDYYKVALMGGQSYTFNANANLSTTDTLDQVAMMLRDSSGTKVSQLSEGTNPSLTYVVPGVGPQIHYIAVSAGGSGAWWDKTGDFSLGVVGNGAVTVPNQIPYAFGTDITLAPGKSVPLSQLFSYGDKDGPSDVVSFDVQDRTVNGGHLTFQGHTMAANTVFERPIGEINQWAFVAGDSGADTIGFNAVDRSGAFNYGAVSKVNVQAPATTVVNTTDNLFVSSGDSSGSNYSTSGILSTMAKFAVAAYHLSEAAVAKDLLNYGWHAIDTLTHANLGSANYGTDGYYINSNASALVAESQDGKALVISFTGTDQFWQDTPDYFPMSDHYRKFSNLFNHIDFSKYSNVYVTGHSLGAAMVQAFMTHKPSNLSNLHNNAPHVEGVAFANPGYEVTPFFHPLDNMVNISIAGDTVAGLGASINTVGDSYLVRPDPGSVHVGNGFIRHSSELYLAIAQYIDNGRFSKQIQVNAVNGADDSREITMHLTGNATDGFSATLSSSGNYTPNHIFTTTPAAGQIAHNVVDAGVTLIREDLTAIHQGIKAIHQGIKHDIALVVYASDTTKTALTFGASVINGTEKVVVSTVNQGVSHLVGIASGLGSLSAKAGDAALHTNFLPMLNTSILNHTLHFEGGPSNDQMIGTTTDRHIVATGGAGNDSLLGGLLGDNLNGGTGNDVLSGGAGNDTLVDAFGNNTLDGGANNDVIATFSGAGTLNGGTGNDLIIGGIGADILSGGDQNDLLVGDISNIFFGNDTLAGGAGNDLLQGGGGADEFVFKTNGGTDKIGHIAVDYANPSNSTVDARDFQTGIDMIKLDGFGYASGTEALSHVVDQAGTATFHDQGTTIVFFGVTTAELVAHDFLIV